MRYTAKFTHGPKPEDTTHLTFHCADDKAAKQYLVHLGQLLIDGSYTLTAQEERTV